ncbi:integrase [Amylibacter ulvae]|uniref:Integrase n=2 Tax=Paramylibacter ulvae TaxID=1651968 RepID=A0ABQ3D828_9RHOB|nr:integrase [Amylibacter ulvae]
MPANDVAQLPLQQIIKRVEASHDNGDRIERNGRAILGLAKPPQINISAALDEYWELAKDKEVGKSPDQVRRMKNPRIKAINNFISVIGDKPIAEITRDDMLDFRDWWMNKIAKRNMSANSANKDFTYLASTLQTINKMKRLNLDLQTSDMRLSEGKKKQRPAFDNDWIKRVLVAPDTMENLNSQARDITLTLVNTGARPSEIVGLLPEHIHLNAPVPYIEILPEGKTLKSDASERELPLVGVSLEAMKRNPAGFPRYRGKRTYSATINKYLRDNGHMPSAAHTIYGLRHTFQDNIQALGISDRFDRDLMGHSLRRERYGKGATLEMKQEILHQIAF